MCADIKVDFSTSALMAANLSSRSMEELEECVAFETRHTVGLTGATLPLLPVRKIARKLKPVGWSAYPSPLSI